MRPPNPSPRRRQKAQPCPETLESRSLLTGGGGNIIALIPGTVDTPGGTAAVAFMIDPAHWTLPKGKVAIGIDVVAGKNSSVDPLISRVDDPKNQIIPQAFHSIYNPHLSHSQVARGVGTRAVLAPLTVGSNTTATFTAT